MKLTAEDFFKPVKGLNLTTRINCLLVYKKARKAYLVENYTKIHKLEDIDKIIKKAYPMLKTLPADKKGYNFFVYLNNFPVRKKNETGQYFTGKILGYDFPMSDMFMQDKWHHKYHVEYYFVYNDKRYEIYGEVIRYKKQLIDKSEKFSKAIKLPVFVELEKKLIL